MRNAATHKKCRKTCHHVLLKFPYLSNSCYLDPEDYSIPLDKDKNLAQITLLLIKTLKSYFTSPKLIKKTKTERKYVCEITKEYFV